MPRPFFVIATQNPVELEGTFPLPEAQIDRFLLRVELGYPTQEEENTILDRFRIITHQSSLPPVTSPIEIKALQAQRSEIRVEVTLRDYMVNIARATRSHPEIDLGASPRATLALFHASQAWAGIHGRDYVIPDDIKFLAPFVLTHRLMIAPQAQLRGRQPTDLVSDIVASLPVPIEN
jgi:MoxR-like ATPase